MIDTHCHIYLREFSDDRKQVLQRAGQAGVTDIFMPAIDFDSLKQMEAIHYPKIRFWKMAGMHPCEVQKVEQGFEDALFTHCFKDDIYGVGETGLDYYWSTDRVEDQKRSLRIHCKVARQLEKPIVLHNRESTSDLLDIVEEEQNGSLRGIWHCFNGTADEGKRAIDLGLHLGIGGVLTFKNAGVDKTVKELPLDKMVLETDAPYLTPAPHRGKRNEPAYVKFTAEKLASVFDLDVGEVVKITSETATEVFAIQTNTSTV